MNKKVSSLSPKNNNNNYKKSSSSIKKTLISKINNIREDKKIVNTTKKHVSSNICSLSNSKKLSKEIKRQKTFDKPDLPKNHKNSKNINNIYCLYPTTIQKNINQESSKDPDNNCSFYCKSNKKVVSLLSQMNQNILNSSRNLINPSRFYKRYFNSLMNSNKKKDIDTPRKRGKRGLTMKYYSNEKQKKKEKGNHLRKVEKIFNI